MYSNAPDRFDRARVPENRRTDPRFFSRFSRTIILNHGKAMHHRKGNPVRPACSPETGKTAFMRSRILAKEISTDGASRLRSCILAEETLSANTAFAVHRLACL